MEQPLSAFLSGECTQVDLRTWPDPTDTESYSLYGMTVLQATTYFRRYASDPLGMKFCVGLHSVHFADKRRRLTHLFYQVALLCLLDTAHLFFSVHMLYLYLIDNFGNVGAVFEIVWLVSLLIVDRPWLIAILQEHQRSRYCSGLFDVACSILVPHAYLAT